MDVDEPVVVVDYDPDWVIAAEREITRLRRVLSDWPVQIEHIGSTAVPGCAAKPIVDIQVGARPSEEPMVAEAIVGSGYESMGEAEPGRIYLRSRRGHHFNVQVVDVDGRLWRNNLALRDFLRSDATACDEYSHAKKRAAAAEPMLLAYSREKDPVLAQLFRRIDAE
jgi:GrpB-like predicted nucleotidyltransferase (UPF0157 family)